MEGAYPADRRTGHLSLSLSLEASRRGPAPDHCGRLRCPRALPPLEALGTMHSLLATRAEKLQLAWWPEEKALRAIGHECGVRYWGEAFVQTKRDFSERQEGDRARCDGE